MHQATHERRGAEAFIDWLVDVAGLWESIQVLRTGLGGVKNQKSRANSSHIGIENVKDGAIMIR